MRIRRWIIIRNGDETRLVSRRPRLDPNEVAVEITIDAPNPPRIVGKVDITLPQPPPAYADATVFEYEEEEEGA